MARRDRFLRRGQPRLGGIGCVEGEEKVCDEERKVRGNCPSPKETMARNTREVAEALAVGLFLRPRWPNRAGVGSAWRADQVLVCGIQGKFYVLDTQENWNGVEKLQFYVLRFSNGRESSKVKFKHNNSA